MQTNKLTPLLRFILCLILTLGSMLILMGSFTLLAYLTKNDFMLTMVGLKTTTDPIKRAFTLLAASLVQNTALVAGPVITTLCIWKKNLSGLGLTSLKQDWKDILTGLFLGFAGITIALICLMASGSAKITGVTTKYTTVISICFLSYVAVALGEEILSRGGLMLALKESKNPLLILGLPSLVFGFMHLGNEGVTPLAIINLVGFGLYASYCFYRSGNIYLPIGFHFAWNFVQGNIYGFHVSGIQNYSSLKLDIVKENIFTGGAFGPEGGLGVTIALILIFILTRFYYRNRSESPFMKNK